jgi:trigger factor
MDIQVELVNISTVKKKLKVEIAAEAAQKQLDEIADEYRRHVRVPGFRPGKAPLALVKRRYQKDIRNDLLQKMIPESYDQAIKEKDIQPLDEPRLENLTYEEGKPLVYEAHFETHPQITLPTYRGLDVRAAALSVTDEDIEAALDALREEHARLTPIEDRPIQGGDFAMVDMHGEYVVPEGERHTHAHGPIDEENVQVEVGAERTHKAFSEALLGMNIAQEKTFEVAYPDDYPQKELAGHTIRFTLEVADIKKKELPELNDDFAKEAGADDLKALRDKVRADITEFREKNRENEIKKKLVAKLAEAAPFEVPDVLVEDQLKDRIRDLSYNIAARGVDPSKVKLDWQKVRAELRAEAERDVRAAMILSEISKAEALDVSDEELEDELSQIAKSMKQPREKIRQHFQKEGRMAGLRAQIRRRKALDLVFENAVVGEEEKAD